MAESDMEKRDVRLKMKEMRAQFPPAEAGVSSRLAGRRLEAFLVFMGACRVGIYAAVRGEMDFSSLWSEGSDAKRTYCFPRVGKDVLHFCPVNHPEEELQPGTLRIPEPVRDIPPLNLNELDVVVIPRPCVRSLRRSAGNRRGILRSHVAGAPRRPGAVRPSSGRRLLCVSVARR